MDDHYHQPIWPMLQGALDYILNLAGEAWAMIRQPNETTREQPVREMIHSPDQNGSVVEHVGIAVKAKDDKKWAESMEGSAVGG